MRGIDRELDVLGLGAGDLADDLPGGGRDIVKVATLGGRHPLAADEILVTAAQRNRALKGLEVRRERRALIHGTRRLTGQGGTHGTHISSPSGLVWCST